MSEDVMPLESTGACPREDLLDEVLASYLDAVALGRPPRQEDLLARYPELAAELAEFFEDRQQFDALASPLREISLRSIPPRMGPADGGPPGPRSDPTPGVADSCTPVFEPRTTAWEESTGLPALDDYDILEE